MSKFTAYEVKEAFGFDFLNMDTDWTTYYCCGNCSKVLREDGYCQHCKEYNEAPQKKERV